ncbi:hypothetical protein SRABI83_03447 [Arthrobacter sp. Bi83]|uniref:hypothetical protein n=1 Tax=Arthrobacter sp. Bi83 TaxID=2822353 RepID=UPI001DCCC1B7|nr:hypothetical protein [Arthrobacter sp. Bi83]CAH0263530.1 hypothetical protein SRABI83_03447 [Arthrobacter sp. Bi83]
MLRFRGLHIVAGIAAMSVAAVLGMIVELNNTAIFTSSCVAYVAVSMWAESRISRRRGQLQGLLPQIPDATALEHPPEQLVKEHFPGEQPGGEQRPVEQRPLLDGNAA